MTTDVIDRGASIIQIEAPERPRTQHVAVPVPVMQLLRWQDDGGALPPAEDRQPLASATTAAAQPAP